MKARRTHGRNAVNRGCGFNSHPVNCRAANRDNIDDDDRGNRNHDVGLRPASLRHPPDAVCLRTPRPCRCLDQDLRACASVLRGQRSMAAPGLFCNLGVAPSGVL